jgi:chromosome segregation ATPase
MDLLEIDRCETEVIPREYPPSLSHQKMESMRVQGDDSAGVALQLISEAAAAIRLFEEESAEALARAHELASATEKKLEVSDARAERAELTVAELSDAVAQAHHELQVLRSQLVAKESQLAATEERAQLAENRADNAEQEAAEANASIERIVNAIRAQLPSREQALR